MKICQKKIINSGLDLLIYSFDKIQGSVGMQGMADFMWLMDRGDNKDTATITGRGRDILDFEYAMEWNETTFSYDYKGNAPEIRSRNEFKIYCISSITSPL